MTHHSAYKTLPLEHGRAADDTTYGIQSLADINVALHDDRERSGRAGDNTTFGVQLFADANVTLHDALERNCPCHLTGLHGVQLSADVDVTLSCCSGEVCRAIRCSCTSGTWFEQYFRATGALSGHHVRVTEAFGADCENTSVNEPMESESTSLAVSAHRHTLPNNHRFKCVRDAVVVRLTMSEIPRSSSTKQKTRADEEAETDETGGKEKR